MKKNKKVDVDIFDEAAEEAFQVKEDDLSKVVALGTSMISIEEHTGVPATEVPPGQWKILKESIDGKHAKRFNDILDTLPDREFVRVYLKAIEYFKPKVVRAAGGIRDEKPIQINIQINK